jgi:segregation and condensation protein B
MGERTGNVAYGALEALLFVSDEPVSAKTLAKMLDQPQARIEESLAGLAAQLEADERGIQLREVAEGWRLYTHPAYHEIIERYVLSWDTRSLSQAALEALAVIAYHQPATRATVNGIRGVNSEGVISSLIEKGLVREAGRDSGPGGAILYSTTRSFLEKFGLRNLGDLPPLADFAPDDESRAWIASRLSANEQSNDDMEYGLDGERVQDEAEDYDAVRATAVDDDDGHAEDLELVD